MAYEVGSLSSLISGIKENSNEKIIFQKKVIKQQFPLTEKTSQNKRKTSSYENITIKSKLHRTENCSEEISDADATDHFSSTPDLNDSGNVSNNAFNALKRIQLKQNNGKPTRDTEQEERTIFVKNLPHTLNKKKIKKIFKEFGEIESIRLRCAAVEDIKISKKFAVIKNKFHAERSTISAFVRFELKEDALSALAANGTLVEDHHIFVDEALNSNKHDQKRSVFLGNVPFSTEEEEIWRIFEKCGRILDIRIVRDMKTGIGKGFAYVTFESADAVELALNLHGTSLKDRPLRVSRVIRKKKFGVNSRSNKMNCHSARKSGQNPHFKDIVRMKAAKRKEHSSKESNIPDRKFSEHTSDKTVKPKQKRLPFQGQKSLDRKQKKKQKINKTEQKKKIIALKLKHKAKSANEKTKKIKHSV
ncbi:RNA-binding protein 34-like [Schistocerca gregaria]|uniref:RNA-binding protein 34-like n=1 Tax=Schistocerca gregaria TaxID=7010 RepID=UPI00211EBC5D|nr:RNA-binding protein 34-like [Schistocerca gregaria]XP_049860201.1 RNA-binding protein 34-like [Schistocerca gregaria]